MNSPSMYLMLAVAGIFAVATSPLAAAGYSQAEITRLHNDVKVLKENATPKAAAVGQHIDPVTSVATGSGSRAELRFPDKSLTRLGANSRFTLRGDSRTLDLEQGVMLLQVPEQIRGAKVRTAAVTAAVTGGTALLEYLPGGYIKLIVIEGFVDVFMNSNASKFKTFNAGQMLIMKADGKFIPDAVDVDLKTLLKTSKLLGDKDDGSINQNLVDNAVNQQQQQIQNGELQPTNLVIPGPGTQVLIDTSKRTNLFTEFGVRDGTPPPQQQGQQGAQPGQGNPLNVDVQKLQQDLAQFQGFAPLIRGKTVLNDNSTIRTNPHVTAYNVRDGGVVTSEGKIYNGNDHGLLQNYVFGNSQIIKPELQEKLNLSGDWALFRFEDLFINGTPIWNFSPGGGISTFSEVGGGEVGIDPPRNVILASNNGIRIGGLSDFRTPGADSDDDIPTEAGGSENAPGAGGAVLDLAPDYFYDKLEKLVLISNNGHIILRSDSTGFAISGYNQDVSIIAAGIGSDVNIEGGIALSAGSEGQSNLDVVAGRDVNITNNNAVVATNIGINSGRDIKVSNSVVRANGAPLKMRSGGSISISNSSQLKALLASPDTLIRLEAQGNVDLNLADLETPGTVDLVSNQGSITLNQVTSSSDVFKATTLSPNGWITIGGSTINATTLINLYAAGANGGVRFVENSTLNSPRVDISGRTVEIVGGKFVDIPKGVLNISTTNRQFNRSDQTNVPFVPNKGLFIIGTPHP
jgi:hypothetical protein